MEAKNFKALNLHVNYMIFNFKFLTSQQKQEITDYLLKLDFSISQDPRNENKKVSNKVFFRNVLKFNSNVTALHFSEITAKQFYKLIKKN